MAKEKWYMTTGRESDEVKRNATKVMFGEKGIRENTGWAWPNEIDRTHERINVSGSTIGFRIIAYTFDGGVGMRTPIDGVNYKIKFIVDGCIREEEGVYDSDIGCFFLDGGENVGVPIECTEEWEEIT